MHRCLLSVAAACFAFAACSTPPHRPDVLFIAVDDLNDWVNCMGGRAGVHTPHLDRLASRGVLFTNAHCAAPACHPSRVAIMTGVRPSTSGVYHNVFNRREATWRQSPALGDAETIPSYFRGRGYRVVGGGKLFHSLQWTAGSQNEPELWDDYFPDAMHPIPFWVRPVDMVSDAEAGLSPGRPLGRSQLFGAHPLGESDELTSDHHVVDWAKTEIARRNESDRPLFLAVGLFRPHIPWEVPKKYFDLYPHERIDLPRIVPGDLSDTHGHNRVRWHEWVTQNGQWTRLVHGYLASISYVDNQVGRLLDALDASGRAGNTIIMLWSDHGMHIGEKENWEKFTLWEESTRVPLMVIAPGVTNPGGRCEQPASLIDVFPTLVELTGGRQFEQMEGLSLLPQLRDPAAHRERPAITTHGRNNHAVRTHRYRYIRYDDGYEELYDHETDPDEFANLVDSPGHRAIKSQLAQWLPGVNERDYSR